MATVNRGVWGGDGSSLPRGKLRWPGPILGRSCGKDMALFFGVSTWKATLGQVALTFETYSVCSGKHV